jgi:DNA-binding NarL/FixJ family response regulator
VTPPLPQLLFDKNGGIAKMLRILIVDDVPMVRAGLRMLLEMHKGWSVCGEAGDGQDAVEKALALNPDVVLLDVSMPHLNGLQAAQLIKRDRPDANIYFLTQYHSLEMARAAADAGARGYIAKVHIPTDLVPAIEALSTNQPLEATP